MSKIKYMFCTLCAQSITIYKQITSRTWISPTTIFIHDKKVALQFRKKSIAPCIYNYMYKRVILGPIENAKAKVYVLFILRSFLPMYSVNSITFLPSFLWSSIIFIHCFLEYIQPTVDFVIFICLPVLPHFVLFFKPRGLPSSAMTTVSLPHLSP